jgi:hypothetical protein
MNRTVSVRNENMTVAYLKGYNTQPQIARKLTDFEIHVPISAKQKANPFSWVGFIHAISEIRGCLPRVLYLLPVPQ